MKSALIKFAASAIFLLATSTSVTAQVKFIKPGAKWHYVFNSFFMPYAFNVTHAYIGDTIIAGDTINIIATAFTNKNNNDCYQDGNTWLKQKGDTIFFKNNLTGPTWQILYNFATPAGQSWTTTFPPATGTLNTYIVMVDSVKTVTINNIPLKQLQVRYFGGPYGTEPTLITERIGCHLFMFNYYQKACSTDQPWFKEFICYKDNSIGSVQIGFRPCSYGASVPELNGYYATNEIQVSPNPATDLINITFQHFESNSSILVCDALGKKIFEQSLISTNATSELNTSTLPNGLYFLYVVNNDGSKSSVKFVIAH